MARRRRGGGYCLDRSGRVETVVGHLRGIGGIALHEDGWLIVSERNVAYKSPANRDEHLGIVGFNDLTTDARGRIYVGSLCSSPLGPAQL